MNPLSVMHNADCMDFMRELPDKVFDLAIVDPPYFSGPERRGFYGHKVSTIGVGRLYHKSERWQIPGRLYFEELKRVARNYIVWGCNYFDYRFNPGRIVWDKCNGTSSFSDCELAATNLFDSVRMFRFMWNGMLQGKSIREGHIMQADKSLNEKRIHPTQKPVLLYVWLLQTFAKEGWSILDTHVGSGSSRIAAYRLGFYFQGCEIDPYYYAGQQVRFEQECLGQFIYGENFETNQLTLFPD